MRGVELEPGPKEGPGAGGLELQGSQEQAESPAYPGVVLRGVLPRKEASGGNWGFRLEGEGLSLQ